MNILSHQIEDNQISNINVLTLSLLQTTDGKDKPNIVTDITTRNSAREDEY
jgi:hypothetical protein